MPSQFRHLHLSHPVWSVRGPLDFNVCSNLLFGNHNDLTEIIEQKKGRELQAYVENMPDMDSVIKVMYEALKTGEGCDNAMLKAIQTQVKKLSSIDL